MKKRPFYNIAHHCNTEREVNESIETQGANAIECDITPVLYDGKIKFQVYHTWDFFKARLISQYTAVEKIDNYFQNLKRLIDNKKLSLIMFDCKSIKGINQKEYAIKLLELLEKHDINQKLCLISVPGNIETIKQFYQGLNEREFKGERDACLDGYAKNNLSNWIKFIKEMGVTFVGLGDDPKLFFSTMSTWLPWLKEAIKLRDSEDSGKLTKVLFWTLNTKRSIRKTLDCGVDGIIANYPAVLNEVLAEQPYRDQFCLATQEGSLLENRAG
jgi:glycerophosphoryl diester phosphodiesterase